MKILIDNGHGLMTAGKEGLMDCFVKPSTIAKLLGKWSLIC